jgi:transcriptional regulator with XRE-family HTH domain
MALSFGDKLKQIRIDRNMSQEELGELLGTSKQVISRYETNQRTPKITIVEEYAKKLNVPLEYLINNSITNLQEVPQHTAATPNLLPPLTTKDERSIQKRLESVLDDLMPNNNALAYYDGDEPMSDDDKELLRISLENTMRLAKQMAKQKFTPKKYRK